MRLFQLVRALLGWRAVGGTDKPRIQQVSRYRIRYHEGGRSILVGLDPSPGKVYVIDQYSILFWEPPHYARIEEDERPGIVDRMRQTAATRGYELHLLYGPEGTSVLPGGPTMRGPSG